MRSPHRLRLSAAAAPPARRNLTRAGTACGTKEMMQPLSDAPACHLFGDAAPVVSDAWGFTIAGSLYLHIDYGGTPATPQRGCTPFCCTRVPSLWLRTHGLPHQRDDAALSDVPKCHLFGCALFGAISLALAPEVSRGTKEMMQPAVHCARVPSLW